MVFRTTPVRISILKNIIFIILLFATVDVGAQYKKLYYGAGAELLLPVMDIASESSFGLGASALVEYKLNPKTGITLSPFYANYFDKKYSNLPYPGNDGHYLSTRHWALLAGVRYYYYKGLFAAAQVGYSRFKYGYYDWRKSLMCNIGLGVKMRPLDVTINYTRGDYYNALSSISMRIGFVL